MAITATFKTTKGTKTWQVSPSRIMDLDGFSTSYELNAESNTAVEGSPLSNQRGMKKKTLSFSSNLVAGLGIDVRKEFESWEPWVGLTGILKIGGTKFGPIWLLSSVKPSDVKIDDSGRFRSMKLTFSFEENNDITYEELLASINAVRSAVGVTASTSQKASKKPKDMVIKQTKWEAAPSEEFAVGELVWFKGGPHYVSSTATLSRKSPKAGPAQITAIVKSAPHAYHVIHTTEESAVYGWVDSNMITKYTATTQTTKATTTSKVKSKSGGISGKF